MEEKERGKKRKKQRKHNYVANSYYYHHSLSVPQDGTQEARQEWEKDRKRCKGRFFFFYLSAIRASHIPVMNTVTFGSVFLPLPHFFAQH